MASETVDPIDWSHPPPYTGQYPLSSKYCTLQCGLQITRLAALSQLRTCDFRMPDQRTAGAATQGQVGSPALWVRLGALHGQEARIYGQVSSAPLCVAHPSSAWHHGHYLLISNACHSDRSLSKITDHSHYQFNTNQA